MTKRISEIEKKIKEIESNKNLKQPKINGFGVGMKISLDLISPIVVGVLIGIGFDNFFLTKPIFFIIFLLLGIVAGFMNIIINMNKLK